MSKFDNIIKKSITTLLEAGIQDPNNPTIKQAVDVIGKALNNSGQIKSNINAKTLTDTLFKSTSTDSTNPLHSAFEKIKQNPESPNLQSSEIEALLKYTDTIKPSSDQENKTTSNTETKSNTDTQKTSNTTTQTSQQPNAKQYNPLNQPAS